MSGMTLVIRLRADGTAEVVGAAKAVETAIGGVGRATAASGQQATATADRAAAAQARLSQLIDQTRSPVERLKSQLAELEALLPFANTEGQIEALIRASGRLEGALAGQSAAAQVAGAAQARLAQLIDQTRTPVERLKGRLAELEALRPFANSADQAEALQRATAQIREALDAHASAASGATAAQARLAQLIDQTRDPVERLRASMAELEALKPFVKTGEEAVALERALATARTALRAEGDEVKAAAAAHAQLSRLLEQGRTPVEALQHELASLEALKPFTRTSEEALVLERALARTRAALVEAERAADPVAVAARRDAEAFAALKSRLDPAATSARDLATAQALLDQALAGQLSGVRLTDAEHAALSATLRQQHGVMDASAGKVKLASWQIWNLGQQAQDAAVQIASGQSPFMVLAQQGPQAASAVGGFGVALRLLLTPVAGVVAGVGALAGGAALVGARIASISAEGRRMTAELRALNPELKITAETMRQMAFSIAEEVGSTRTDAAGALAAAARNRAIRDVGLLRDIAAVAQDVAAVTGRSADEVAARIADAYSKGAAGIAQLDEELGFLTREQAAHVRLLEDEGRRTEALGTATAALKDRFGGALREMRSEWGNAFREMGQTWDALIEKIGNSDFSKILAKVSADVGKGFQWWVKGMPAEIARAVEMADVQKTLDEKTKQLEAAVSRGAKGRGVDILRQQVFELQKRFYALAETADAAAKAKDEATAPSATSTTTYAPGGGRQRTSTITESEGKQLDAAAEANERYVAALRKVGGARQVAMAGVQAYEAALAKGWGREARLEAAAQAEEKVRRELGAAVADQTAQYGLQVKGLLATADAYGVSTAAGVVAQAQAQAAIEGYQKLADVDARQRELIREGAAGQAVAIAQSTAAIREETGWTLRVAEATRDGVGARDEMQRRADVARTTSQLLAFAQAAEAQGDTVLARTLRDLAAGYDTASKAAAQARQMAAGADAIRVSSEDLAHARAELGLMGETQVARDRALASLRIQRQAMELFKDTSTAALRLQRDEWVALQERIADTQALTHFHEEVRRVSEGISGDVAEALYDRLMDADEATSVIDFFKSIFKRLVVEALKTQIVLPVVMQAVGAVPQLFGIQPPAGAAGQAGAAGGGLGGMGNLLSLGSRFIPSGWTSGIASAIDMWGATTLGIGTASTMPTTVLTGAGGMLTGGGATSILPGQVAAGTGLTSYLGPLGIGAGIGGLLPSLLGIQNKAMGALAGGGAGAAAGALAGSLLFPGVGTLVGALLGGGGGLLGGLFGTSKPSVGPIGAATVNGLPGQRMHFVGAGSDNGGDPAAATQLAQAVIQAINGTLDVYGGRIGNGFGNNPGISQSQRGTTATLGDGMEVGTFGGGDEAAAAFVRAVLERIATDLPPEISTALAHSTAKSLQDLAADIDLAGRLGQADTALKSLDTSLAGVARAAKESAAQTYAAAIEEKKRADALGLGGQWASVAERQIRASWASAAQSWMPMERAMAEADGRASALKEAIAAMGLAISDAEVDAQHAAEAAQLRRQADAEFQASIYAAQGREYLTQLGALRDGEEGARRNLAAAGVDDAPGKAAALVVEQARAVLRGLDTAQLADVAATLGGAIGDLARSMQAGAAAADAAAQAQAAAEQAAEAAVAQARADQDLTVRRRHLQGTADADDYERGLQQERELAEAQAAGRSAAYIEGLRYVHQLENEAATKERAAQAAEQATQQASQAAAAAVGAWQDLVGRAASGLGDAWREIVSTARSAAQAWRGVSDQLGRAGDTLAGSQYSNLGAAGQRDAAREHYEILAATIADYAAKARLGVASDNDRQRALAAANELQQAGERWLETQRTLSGDAAAYDRALTDVRSGWNAARDVGLEIESAEEARARQAEQQIDWLSRMYGADVRQEALLGQIRDAMAKGPEGLSELLRLVRQVPGAASYQVPAAVQELWNGLSPAARKGVLARSGYTGPTGGGQALDWLAGQGPEAQARWELSVRDAATAARFQPSSEGQRIWTGLPEAERLEVLARLGYAGPTGQGQAIDWVTATGTGSMWEYYVRQAGAGLLSAGRTISASALPQFASGGDHAGGLRVVGERGWEVEATGAARLWSHEQAREILSPKQVNVDVTPVVVAVEGVRAVVQDVGRAIGGLIDRVGGVEAAVGRLAGETMLLHTRLGKLAVR